MLQCMAGGGKNPMGQNMHIQFHNSQWKSILTKYSYHTGVNNLRVTEWYIVAIHETKFDLNSRWTEALSLSWNNCNLSMDKRLHPFYRWEWITTFIPHFTGHAITYPSWDWSLSMLVKGAYDNNWHPVTWHQALVPQMKFWLNSNFFLNPFVFIPYWCIWNCVVITPMFFEL